MFAFYAEKYTAAKNINKPLSRITKPLSALIIDTPDVHVNQFYDHCNQTAIHIGSFGWEIYDDQSKSNINLANTNMVVAVGNHISIKITIS